MAGADPKIGTTAYHVGSTYVAGVSTIQLKAPVTAVDVCPGESFFGLRHGGLHCRPLGRSGCQLREVGESFVAVGTQPAVGGVGLGWTWPRHHSRLLGP